MNSKQAKLGLVLSLVAIVLSLAGAFASAGRPTGPLLMTESSQMGDGCLPTDLRFVVVNFPPETNVIFEVSRDDGAWTGIAGAAARTDALGEADVRLADSAQLLPSDCAPQEPPVYRFRAIAENGADATSEERELNAFVPGWVEDEPGRVPQPPTMIAAPIFFVTAIGGLLGMLISGAFVAYPRGARPRRP